MLLFMFIYIYIYACVYACICLYICLQNLYMCVYFLMVDQYSAGLHPATIPRDENWGPIGCSAQPPCKKAVVVSTFPEY